MASVRAAMQAKSDQLNYVDIGEGELIITITQVNVGNSGNQDVVVFYEGCGKRPWKPSKGMIRVLGDVNTWGDETDNWVGKSVKLYGDPDVKWAGEAQGGIRIRALSDINKNGVDIYVAESRGKRRKKHFDCLEVTVTITETDQGWIDAVREDPTVLDQIEKPAYKARIKSLSQPEEQ